MSAPTKRGVGDNSRTSNKQRQQRSDNSKSTQSFARKKKEWRKQKYKQFVGNVKEGQGFADRRKIRMMHEYRKVLRKDKQKLQADSDRVQSILRDPDDGEDTGEEKQGKMRKKKMKVSAFHKAELEYQKQAKEKDQKKQEAEKKKKAQQEAEAKYKKKKKARHKALSRKTFLGQPSMSSQIDYLLKQIESQKNS